MIIDCTNVYYGCLCISPILVYLCIYSFCIYFRSLNTIACNPLLFAFLLFSHFFEVDEMEDGGTQWDSESMLMFKTSRFPRCVLVHFFRFYFLFAKASWWYRPAGVEACWGKSAEIFLRKHQAFISHCHVTKGNKNDEVVFRRNNTKILTVSIMLNAESKSIAI